MAVSLAGNPSVSDEQIQGVAATRRPAVLAALAYRERIDPAIASLFSDNFESRTIRTRLRKSASDRYFLEATEMSNERDKKSRTFATATEFITWASNPRIKDPKTIRLTKHNPDLLTLATLARVLDVLDG